MDYQTCKKKRSPSVPKQAERIRQLYLNAELSRTWAINQALLFDQDFKLHSKSRRKKDKRLAMQAKMAREAHKIYARNVENIIKQIDEEVDYCLRGYSEKYQYIWRKYFLEHKSIEEISTAIDFTYDRTAHILLILRKDLSKDDEMSIQ